MNTMPLVDIEKEALRLVSEASRSNISLRLLGGLAVKLRCPSSAGFNPDRKYHDIDLAVNRKGGVPLTNFFSEMGYEPDRTMNLLNGDRRQVYIDEVNERHVDVFVGDFEMCHRIPLEDRLGVEEITLPLIELFLTKIQIVELNYKDVADLFSILTDHPVRSGDEYSINQDILKGLCSKDWGLYTTIHLNLDKLLHVLDNGSFKMSEDQKHCIYNQVTRIKKMIEEVPKTKSWKVRSVIGTHVRWYLEVEEVRR